MTCEQCKPFHESTGKGMGCICLCHQNISDINRITFSGTMTLNYEQLILNELKEIKELLKDIARRRRL